MGDEPDKTIVATKVIAATMLGALTSLVAAKYPWLAHAVAGIGAGVASLAGDRPRAMLDAAREFEGERLHTGFSLLLLLGPNPNRPPSEAEVSAIERRFSDPFLHSNARVITRAFLEALEDEALVPLATLARTYLLERRRVDPFYRSTARFLTEADAPLIHAAADFVRRAHEVVTEDVRARGPSADEPKISFKHGGGMHVEIGLLEFRRGAGFLLDALGSLDEPRDQDVLAAFAAAGMGHPLDADAHALHIYVLQSDLKRLAIVFGIDDDSAS